MTQITIGVILKESFSSKKCQMAISQRLSEVSIDLKNIFKLSSLKMIIKLAIVNKTIAPLA
jgi:hypothetical protein